MSKTISIAEGKTATIVSPSQLAINVGTTHGVQVGDLIAVRKSVEIKNPDDDSSLGQVHLVRLRLRVTIVAESFSVGAVIDEVAAGPLAILDVTRITRYKTISDNERNADSNTVYIKPGEPVIVTRDAEDEPDSSDK